MAFRVGEREKLSGGKPDEKEHPSCSINVELQKTDQSTFEAE
jgi:hypothetical protein